MTGLAETDAPDTHRADDALPAGQLIGNYELRDVVHRGVDGIVYRAWDRDLGMAIAVMEHRPARLVRRLPGGDLAVVSPAHQAAYAASLQAFVRISRMLAHCDHPSLVRMLQLQFAHGTAYRVMPWIDGEPLTKLRRRMPAPPGEAALRALLDPLLGALETLHATGMAHGGVEPGNILMQREGRPVLLSPPAPNAGGSGAAPQPWVDLLGVANVVRFMIDGPPGSGVRRAKEPVAAAADALSFQGRPVGYGAGFLRAIDAAASPQGAQQLGSVAGLRERLREAPAAAVRRVPGPDAARPGPITVAPAPAVEPVAAAEIEIGDAPDHLRPPRSARPRHAGRSAAAVAVLVAAAAAGIWWGLQDGSPTAVTPRAGAAAPAPLPQPPAPEVSTAPAAQDAPPSATAAVSAPGAAAASTSPKPEQRSAPTVAAAQSPRQVCGARTEFSLYRCMQQQCARPAWRRHPQCVRFSITDQVD